MKTALCLSGQPRYLDDFAPRILNNLIIPNNCDVFLHMWYSDEEMNKPFRPGEGWKHERITKDADKKVLELLKPIKYIIEPQIQFTIPEIDWTKTLAAGYGGGAEKKEIADYYVFGAFSLWYGIWQSNMLRQEFACRNNIKYDRVIKCRIDMPIDNVIMANNFNPNELYFCECSGRSELVHDWFHISGEYIANIYSNIYTMIEYLYRETGIWCNEYNIKYLFDKLNIKTTAYPFPVHIVSKLL